MKKLILFLLTILLLGGVNATVGDYISDFSYSGECGATSGTGIASNYTTLFLICGNTQQVYVYTLSGSYTGQNWDLSSIGSDNPLGGEYYNNKIYWIDNNDDAIYVTDILGNNQTGGFNFSAASSQANNNARGLTTNGTSIFINDITDDEVYEYSMSGVFIRNWDVASIGLSLPTGMTNNLTDIWIADSDPDDTAYHLDMMGNNLSASFKFGGGSTGVRGIDIGNNYTGATNYSFWVVDNEVNKIFQYEGPEQNIFSEIGGSFTFNLTSPINGSSISDVGANFTINYTGTNMNFTNSTYYIYNSTGELHNSTFLLVSGVNNFSTLYIDEFGLGNYLWNSYVCGVNDTTTICSWNSAGNYSFEVGALLTGQIYNASTFESSKEDFIINITLVSGTILYSAKLNYNNVNYSTTYTSLGNNKYRLNASVFASAVATSSDIPFYWIFSYDSGGTQVQYTSNTTQIVNPLQVISITSSACAGGFFESINYSFANSNNLTNLTVNLGYNFKYGVGNTTSKNIYGNLTNTEVLRVCVNQTFGEYRVGYGEIDYQLTDYVERRFYVFDGFILSNSTTSEYTLYSLPNADSTSFLFEIKDVYLNPYVDKYLNLLRWYPDLNEYRVVEAAITDENGLTIMKVKIEDIDYRVGVYEKDGTLIELTSPVRMACLVNPCTYTIKITAGASDYLVIYNIQSSLVFDEDTNRFIFTWNDPSQQTSAMRLNVYKDAGYQKILICNTTSSGYIGVITCDIGNYTGNFFATAYRTASPENPYASLWYTVRDAIESSFGLFVGFIISLVAGLIGIFNPIGAILLLLISLIPIAIFGTINIAIFMGIVTLGGIIIHFLRKT